MLLTERRGRASSPGEPGGPEGPPTRGLSLLGAVTRSDSLLLRVRGRRLLDHRPHDRLIGLDPVSNEVPFLPVPLLELDRAAPLMVHAGDLDRLQEAEGPEFLQALFVDVQILQAPAHLLARQRLLAELRLSRADGLRVQDAVDDAAVVIHLAEAVHVFEAAL